jgi:ATP-dependent Clp protease ATP-binding subunit ClpA
MFERFTHDAREVVATAEREARELGHGRLGSEHLLLGVAVAGGPAGAALAASGATAARLRGLLAEAAPAEALEAIGIDLGEVRRRAEAAFGPGALERGRARRRGMGSPRFTPPARVALELALREAIHLGDDHIGTEHILLGLLRAGDPAAIAPLERAGADPARVRAALLDARDARPRPASRRGLRRRRGA